MICHSCKAGAEWNTRWREERPAPYARFADMLHKECTGCCCQHATGEDSLKVLTQGVGA